MIKTRLKLAVADMLSNSYFPVIAAVRLGAFERQGLEVELELVSPTQRTYQALADGAVDLVGAEAHGALSVFPRWRGMKLLCAQSHGMYWMLVMRADLGVERGDLSAVRGRMIAAAPFVEMGLRRMLSEVGIDPARDLEIAPLPELLDRSVNTGITLAQALKNGRIDGFWANAMGAEIAVLSGAGTIVLDVRRGDGPAGAFDYTLPVVAAADRLLARGPDIAKAVVAALAETHNILKADVSQAGAAAKPIFTETEAGLITELIRRDLPYYDTSLPPAMIVSLNKFSIDMGLLDAQVPYEAIVPAELGVA